MKKLPIKEVLVSAGALTIIGACVTFALAGTNALTAKTIAKRVEQTETAARQEVLAADRFEEQLIVVDGKTVTYYQAIKDNQPVGYVFTAETAGKAAGMVVMTGIRTDGTIAGVKVTENNETAGYVDKVTKGGLLKAFEKKKVETFKLGDQIDGVSQATKTSTGVTKGVNLAVTYFNTVQKEAAK